MNTTLIAFDKYYVPRDQEDVRSGILREPLSEALDKLTLAHSQLEPSSVKAISTLVGLLILHYYRRKGNNTIGCEIITDSLDLKINTSSLPLDLQIAVANLINDIITYK